MKGVGYVISLGGPDSVRHPLNAPPVQLNAKVTAELMLLPVRV